MSIREKLKIGSAVLKEINDFLLSPDNPLINRLLDIISKYGTPPEINAKAREAKKLPNLFLRLKELNSPYLKDLEWLQEQKEKGSFISIPTYRRKILGEKVKEIRFDEKKAVTLEISALQYFPWLIREAQQAIEKQEIMPGRYIRVRKMKEQEQDQGELYAISAAMQIMGASYVETLDTRGTDGSNIHLGGPETITGYFGGVGQPNEHALQWVDEYLYYYTRYGVQQVLNINSGTILLGYLLYRLGIDMEFKISVYTGHDNPYSVLWTLIMAKLFCREDGTTPLAGINLSNSVNVETLELSSLVRKGLGLEEHVRLEHHITETWKSIVIQPYNRREDLLKVAPKVPNISAKHEGGEIDVERQRSHPSDILDYFRDKEEILSSGEMGLLEQNYMDKHEAVNQTAKALTERGLSFIGARNLHRLNER